MFFAAFFGRGAWGGMRDRGDQISALTGLRFVAALSVALAHATSFIAIPGLRLDYWMQSSAAFGMTLFFVLSGFVIHYNYRSIAGSASEIARFFWIRFARLYPLFVLVLLIDILLGAPVGSYLAGKSDGMDDILG